MSVISHSLDKRCPLMPTLHYGSIFKTWIENPNTKQPIESPNPSEGEEPTAVIFLLKLHRKELVKEDGVG